MFVFFFSTFPCLTERIPVIYLNLYLRPEPYYVDTAYLTTQVGVHLYLGLQFPGKGERSMFGGVFSPNTSTRDILTLF